MSQPAEAFAFNGYHGLVQLMDHLKDVEGLKNLEVIRSYLKKKQWTSAERRSLLYHLSSLLCDERFSRSVASIFTPLLLDLLLRAQEEESKSDFVIALSNLIGHFSSATQLCYRYFKSASFPFESVIKLSLDPRKAKRQKTWKTEKTTVASLRAAFNFLWFNTQWFVESCDWSPVFNSVEDEDVEVRWLSCHCVRLISGMNECDFNEWVSRKFDPIEELQLRAKYNDMFNSRESLTPAKSQPNPEHSSDTSFYFIGTDFVDQVVSVCGVLLTRVDLGVDSIASQDSLVIVPSVGRILRSLALSVSGGEPVLLEGPVGCGKSSLVEYLASMTGRKQPPRIMKVQLGDQIDGKLLIGTHCCTEIAGEFLWKAGPLTEAMINGNWLLLEDIDCAPPDVVTILASAMKTKSLASLPGCAISGHKRAHGEFRIFFTRRIVDGHAEFMMRSNGVQDEIEKLCNKISINTLNREELDTIIRTKWPVLESIAKRILDIYFMLTDRSLFEEDVRSTSRHVSMRDLVKWCQRIATDFRLNKEEVANMAFLDAVDCFLQSLPGPGDRVAKAEVLGAEMNLSKSDAQFLCSKRKPDLLLTETELIVGRSRLKRVIKQVAMIGSESKGSFAHTLQSLALLERISVSVSHNEPVLLVGETGTGKTSTVQYLAKVLGNSLSVVNMNQQSDSCDLLGGYKPVEVSLIIQPIRREFEQLFAKTFALSDNAKFLNHINNCFQSKKWADLFTLMLHVLDKATKKAANELKKNWRELGEKVKQLQSRCEANDKGCLAFTYIEGTLVKAMREGSWILLDEINLAEAETLQCLSSVLDSSHGSLILLDKADGLPVKRHPQFRLFACMNPATDVGKKELPLGIRNRFTEFFVDELVEENDLRILVDTYLHGLGVPKSQINKIVCFYLRAKLESKACLNDTCGQRPHYSLRTLCRALSVGKTNPCGLLSRSLYEALCLSFLTQLDRESCEKVEKLITEYLLGDKNASSIKKLDIAAPKGSEHLLVEGYWLPVGPNVQVQSESYILTPSVRKNLKDLARNVSIGKTFPVLLQGETSVGKTSLIQWLSQATGNVCLRVNNHEHTDLQEYIGTYCSDTTGALVFKEGVLVEAMRNGYWIILDELNLAPTEVLEALNRVLDDNRELFIAETQQVVKAHPRFLLFATQNPPGHYGGRKILSRAFRNRFVELHFDDIPSIELETILHQRCSLPLSYAKKMVKVMLELQLRRRETGVFAGKHGFITLRDLFRWGERYRLFAQKFSDGEFYDWDLYLAKQGYILLAGRVRKEEESQVIQSVFETNFKRKLPMDVLYDDMSKSLFGCVKAGGEFEHLVWTKDLTRLWVLLMEALNNKEPVLLVGDTGCGKTTMCQLFAHLKQQSLYTVNCHMHSEGADFLGSLRPVRSHDDNDNRLFEWVDGPLVDAMKEGSVFLMDEISLADDSVLERLNSVLEPERTLLLNEKSSDNDSSETAAIVAKETFRLVATMNPGGDYGKKELSPALRNRFTEIWCPSTSDLKDIAAIVTHNISSHLKQEKATISQIICDFLTWFNNDCSARRSSVSSIRDVLSWVQFINATTGDASCRCLTVPEAIVNGAQLVFIDAIGCSGYTSSDCVDARVVSKKCFDHLKNLVTAALGESMPISDLTVDSSIHFGIEPFYVMRGKNTDTCLENEFTFESENVAANAVKVLRAMQLPKPILLEGFPGVGKTSLVQALAKATGHDVIRINLSEQTDISDLFGADLPNEGDNVGGTFSWRDGPLLQALKSDSCWIVLDELNLASQSVLEGLNACLDHRGEVYVPELSKSFQVKKTVTRIFACQNPYGQGGARKGLPKSFLNRFTAVFMDTFTEKDLEFIVSRMFPEIPSDLRNVMVLCNQALVRELEFNGDHKQFGRKGSPWELNLRDLFRWSQVMIAYSGNNVSQVEANKFLKIIYMDRFRSREDREAVALVYEKIFEQPFQWLPTTFSITPSCLQVGTSALKRTACNQLADTNFRLLHGQLSCLESLMKCIEMNWLAILMGPSGVGKTALVQLLSTVTGHPLKVLTVNSEMDAMELLGGFEQKDYVRHLMSLENDVWEQLRSCVNELSLVSANFAAHLMAKWYEYRAKCSNVSFDGKDALVLFVDNLNRLEEVLKAISSRGGSNKRLYRKLNQLKARVDTIPTLSGGGNFEWIDSLLVTALKTGEWLLVDDVNLCSSAVLDRLNGLLEPNGVLIMNEQGVVDNQIPVIKPHPDFRLIMTMDPKNGELSRAMRNRGIEIFMLSNESKRDLSVLLEAKGLGDKALRNRLIAFHEDLANDTEFNPMQNLSTTRLLGAVQQIVQELQQKTRLKAALKESLQKTYSSLSTSAEVTEKINKSIEAVLDNLEECSQSESAVNVRHFIGDTITANAIEDQNMLMFINNNAFSRSLRGQEILTTNETLLMTTAARLFAETCSKRDYEMRLKILEGSGCQLFRRRDLTSTSGQISKLISGVELEPFNLSEMPVDFRFNRLLWDQLWSSPKLSPEGRGRKDPVGKCLNQWLLNLFWYQIKAIETSTRKDVRESFYSLSEAFKRKKISGNDLPSPVIKYIHELTDEVEEKLVKSALKLSPNDEDYMQLKAMMIWIHDLFSLCFSECSKKERRHRVDQFLVLWTLTNQFSMSRLQTFFEVDINDLLSRVNGALGIETIEHRKGFRKLVNNFVTNVRFANSDSSSKLLTKTCELLVLLRSFKGSLLHVGCQHKLLEVLQGLVGSNKAAEAAVVSKMSEVEKDMRQAIVPRNEDEEENDEDLLAMIKRRDIVITSQLVPLWQLFFNLAEKKALLDHENEANLLFSLLGSKTFFAHPIHRFHINLLKEKAVSSDLILYHFLDLNAYFNNETILTWLNCRSDKEVNDDCQESGWSSKAISMEASPTFSLIALKQLANSSFGLGLMKHKRQQIEELQQFIWTNYNFLSEPFDALQPHQQLLKNWLNKIKPYCLSSDEANDSVLRPVFERASHSLEMASASVLSLASAETLTGLITSQLFAPLNTIDPVERNDCKLRHFEMELELIDAEMLLRNTRSVAAFGSELNPSVEHPHVAMLFEHKHVLETKIAKLRDRQAFRPTPSLYQKLRKEVKHFLDNVLRLNSIDNLMNRIKRAIESAKTAREANLVLQEALRVQTSITNFIHHIMDLYPLYADLTHTFLVGVSMTEHGLKLFSHELQAVVAAKEQPFAPKEQLGALAKDLANYLTSDPVRLSERIANLPAEELMLESLTNTRSKHRNVTNLFKAALIDLTNGFLLNKSNKDSVIASMSSILRHFLDSWQKNEAEKEAKRLEEEAVFEFKTRTHEGELNEEEQALVDIANHFPSFSEDYRDLVETNLMGPDDEPKKPAMVVDVQVQDCLGVIDVHQKLVSQLSDASAASDAEINFKDSFDLRYNVVAELVDSFGPLFGNKLDNQLIDGHLVACQHLMETSKETKTFNIYKDHLISELSECHFILDKLQTRIMTDLLLQFPGHPTLTKLLRIINRMFEFPVTSPLVRFVTGLEVLLEAAQDWQKMAHRGINLTNELAEVTQLIIKWRKLELKHWSQCLTSVENKFEEQQLTRWWFHFYVLIDALKGNPDPVSYHEELKQMMGSLKQLLESSKLGEYRTRLHLLDNFMAHLQCVDPQVKSDPLFAVLYNVSNFYKQFENNVKEKVDKERVPIEKAVAQFVKIMRWNDMNFWSVKSSVDKSQRTLQKYMKKYEFALTLPTQPLFVTKPGDTVFKPTEQWTFSVESGQFITKQRLVEPLNADDSSKIIGKAVSLFKKSKKFSKETINFTKPLQETVNGLNEMVGEMIVSINELQALQVASDIKDKVKWKKAAHQIHNRKRKALSDLLKHLTDCGLSYPKGVRLFAEHSVDDVFIKTGPIEAHLLRPEVAEDVGASNRYFYSCLARFSVLSKLLENPSKELTMSMVSRIRGFTGHLMYFVVEKRKACSKQLSYFTEARTLVRNLAIERDASLVEPVEARKWCETASDLVQRFATLLVKLIDLLKSRPTCIEHVVVLSPASVSSNHEKSRETIRSCLSQMLKLTNDCSFNSNLLSTQDMKKAKKIFDTLLRITLKANSCKETDHGLFKCIATFSDELSAKFEQFNQFHEAQMSSTTSALDVEISRKRLIRSADGLLLHVINGIGNVYKHFSAIPVADGTEDETLTAPDIKQSTDFSFFWKTLNMSVFDDLLKRYVNTCNKFCGKGDANDRKFAGDLLRTLHPFLSQYLNVCDFFVGMSVACLRVNSKLLHVLLGLFSELSEKGFCLPPELSDETETEQGTEFKDISDAGFGEGEGAEDVSERVENEDQLEDAFKAGSEREEKNDDKDVKDEEHGIEMSEDFDAKPQSPQGKADEEDEDKDDSDSDSEKDEDLEKQMGDLDDQDEVFDQKLWGGDDDDEDSDEELSDIDHDGGQDDGDNKLVAKDDNRGLKDGDDQEDDRKDEQEDDIDEVNEGEEKGQDDEYEGEKEDPYKTKKAEMNEEHEAEDFPEEMELDADEAEEGGDEQELEKEASEEKKGEEEEEGFNEVEPTDDGGDQKEDAETEEEDNEEDEEGDKKDAESNLKTEENKEEETEDDKDAAQKENLAEDSTAAETMPTEVVDSSLNKDNVEAAPNEVKDKQQENSATNSDKKEEYGIGEAEVGQQNSEGHEGLTEAKTVTDEATKEGPDRSRPQPREKDRRSLAQDKERAKRQKVLENDDRNVIKLDVDEDKVGKKSSNLYQHVEEKDEADDEVIDLANEEDALKSRPNKEDEKGDELGDTETNDEPEEMETDDKHVDEKVTEELKSMSLKSEEQKKKELSKNQKKASKVPEEEQEDIQLEGEIIETQGAQRGNQSSIHTQSQLLRTAPDGDKSWMNRMKPIPQSNLVFTEEAALHWQECGRTVAPLVYELCQQLQLVLEPTKTSKLKGDYRTGKRLNMRKVVSYIASQFRKDKIWLKRTKPSKRQYQIVLAVDDSSSMADNQSKQLAFESLALLSKSLSLLEAGELAVMSFGEDVQLMHPFNQPFTDSVGSKLLTEFTFNQNSTRIAGLLEAVSSLMLTSRTSAKSNRDISQLLLIISDGRGLYNEGEDRVKQLVRRVKDLGIFMVFVVLDNPQNKGSILDIKSTTFDKDCNVTLKPYMESFPFPFYIILRDINSMPVVLGEALRQWFELVTSADR